MTESKKQTTKYILQIYSLTVSFLSSIVIMISFAVFLMNLAYFLMPDVGYGDQLSKFQSNDNYIDDIKNEIKMSYSDDSKKDLQKKLVYFKKINAEEFLRYRETKKTEFLNQKKTQNLSTGMVCLSWAVSSFVLLSIHILLYKRAKV